MNNTLWSLIEKVGQLTCNFISIVVVARLLEQEDFAIYALSSMLLLMFWQLSSGGIKSIFIIYYSKYQHAFEKRFWLSFLLIKLILLVVFSIPLSWYLIEQNINLGFLFVSLLLVFLSCIEPIEWKMEASFQQFILAWSRLFSGIVGLLLKLLVAYKFQSIGLLLIIVAFELLFYLQLVRFFSEKFSSCKSQAGDIFDLSTRSARRIKLYVLFLVSKSYPLFLSMLCVLLYNRVDQVMLLELSSANELALYSVAIRLSEPFTFIPMAICATALPFLASLFKQDKVKYEDASIGYSCILFYCGLFLSGLMFLLAPYVLPLVFGSKYLQAVPVLQIHSLSLVFSFIAIYNGIQLVVIGQQKFATSRSLAAVVINIVCNFLLIPSYGAVGASIATSATLFLSGTLFFCMSKKTASIFSINLKSIAGLSYLKSVKF